MKKINYELLNDIMFFLKKILKLVYVSIIAIIAFLIVKVFKEAKIMSFICTIFKILSPLFIGFAITWVLNPLVDKLENKGLNRCLSSIIVFALFVIILAVILILIIPILYHQIIDFTDNIPDLINTLENLLNGRDIHKYLEPITSSMPNMFISSIKTILSWAGIIGLSLIFSLYLLMDYHKINACVKRMLKKEEYAKLLIGINKEVRKCVNGTILVATIVFILDTIFFAIFKLPSSLLFGLFCGLTDLIPYIGPYIGGALAVLVGFSESKFLGIVTLIIVVVVQLLENLVLQPYVMSKAIKLHPVTIILALTIASSLFGIVGMIIATPLLAMLKVIYTFIRKEKYIN